MPVINNQYICPHKWADWGKFGYQPHRVCRRAQCQDRRDRIQKILTAGWIGFSSTKLMRNLHVLTEIARCDMMPSMSDPAAIFCGDRNWDDWKAVSAVMRKLHPRLVIEGDARGADRIAGLKADFLGIARETYPAHWDKHHRAAGPIRNRQMLDRLLQEPEPRLVVAFHDDLAKSKGTKNMVTIAKKAGVRVMVVKHRKREE